jgi:signal transduction histidine kinase
VSICRSIVEAHGGRLQAVRNEDGGARFIVSVPAEKGVSGSRLHEKL